MAPYRLLLAQSALVLLFSGPGVSHVLSAQPTEDVREEAQGMPVTEEAIRRALDDKTSLNAMNRPLGDVMHELSERLGIPIVVDRRGLEDVGLGLDTPVSLHFDGLSLRSILRLALRDLDLNFTIRDKALLITSAEKAEYTLRTEVFDVLDLVRPHADATPDEYDYDTIIDLITTTVEQDTWDEVGGPGSISAFRGSLVISQTQDVVDQISGLLAALRQAKKVVEDNPHKLPAKASIGLGRHEELNAPVFDALKRVVTWSFQELALADIADEIERKHAINVQLDARALDAYGIGVDTPITFSIRNLELRQALTHMLRDLELTWLVRDEVLIITTDEEAEQNLFTRVYPVMDLLGQPLPAHEFEIPRRDADTSELVDLTMAIVQPDTWEWSGGMGSIAEIPQFGILVVAQTQDVHRQVDELLAQMRNRLADRPPVDNTANAKRDSELRLAIYAVPHPVAGLQPNNDGQASAEGTTPGGFFQFGTAMGLSVLPAVDEHELLDIIKQMIEPESWNRDDVYARAAGGRLIVRQTNAVHRKIRALAERLGLYDFHEIGANRNASSNWGCYSIIPVVGDRGSSPAIDE